MPRPKLTAALLTLVMPILGACAANGPAVPADPCPTWLGAVAPIYLPDEPQDAQLERDVIALGEAGEAVGCW